jgi:predicted RNA binding protein YcfA (HicA-like mRNA interferase family)
VTSMSGKKLARTPERNGWTFARVNGSHHIYTKPGSIVRRSVPIHGNSPLKIGLLHHLLKQAGLSVSDVEA